MPGADLGIAVAHEVRGCDVDGEGDDAEDAEGPGQAEGIDHLLRCEGVDQAAEPGAGGGDGVSEAALACEPLRDNADAADEEEADADAEADALGEQELVFLVREAGGDKGEGLEEDAHVQADAGAVEVHCMRGQRGDDHGQGDGETSDEGVV